MQSNNNKLGGLQKQSIPLFLSIMTKFGQFWRKTIFLMTVTFQVFNLQNIFLPSLVYNIIMLSYKVFYLPLAHEIQVKNSLKGFITKHVSRDT